MTKQDEVVFVYWLFGFGFVYWLHSLVGEWALIPAVVIGYFFFKKLSDIGDSDK